MPTQRSLTARHRKKSFVDGAMDNTRQRAMMTRMLPRKAKVARMIFKAENKSTIPFGNVCSASISPLSKLLSSTEFDIVLDDYSKF